MNFDETSQVLAAIQIYDNRRVDDATVKAWHKMIGRFTLADCLAAVEQYFTTNTDWLMPAHIIRNVKAFRSRRIELAGNPVLNTADEYDEAGNRLPDAKRKQDHLVNLVANGQLDADQYKSYKSGRLTLQQLGNQARELTG